MRARSLYTSVAAAGFRRNAVLDSCSAMSYSPSSRGMVAANPVDVVVVGSPLQQMAHTVPRAFFLSTREEGVDPEDLRFHHGRIESQRSLKRLRRRDQVSPAAKPMPHKLQVRDPQTRMRCGEFRIALQHLREPPPCLVKVLTMPRTQQKTGQHGTRFQVFLRHFPSPDDFRSGAFAGSRCPVPRSDAN